MRLEKHREKIEEVADVLRGDEPGAAGGDCERRRRDPASTGNYDFGALRPRTAFTVSWTTAKRPAPTSEAIYRKLYSLTVRAYNGRYNGHEEPEDEVAPTIDVNSYTVHHGPEYQKRGDGTGTTFAVCQWHYQLAQLPLTAGSIR